ncbi:MAG TPA: hypothetical protein VEY91_05885 [Candidatus Limnocylindria bacterium]|nr:hypothetical protein [Candidatus Limnocylindria bacterium]
MTLGYVLNDNIFDAWSLWLGCFGVGTGLSGTDNDDQAKYSAPGGGTNACSPSQSTDCTTSAFETLTFSQDECYGDNDSGLRSTPEFTVCAPTSVTVSYVACIAPGLILNVLIDMNGDGDWNDSFSCTSGTATACAYEWAIKNYPLPYPNDRCGLLTLPEFMMGPIPGPAWMRITLSIEPVSDSFPWNGARLRGGETEDYPAAILVGTPVTRPSWGSLKTHYR